MKKQATPKEKRWIEHPLPPVVDHRSRVLILGSMPGEASLAARAYYAFPRNHFWDIMAALFEFDRNLAYEHRLEQVRQHGIALWDMIASCRRTGSLDAAIDPTSVRSHDIGRLLNEYPSIGAIGFNGREAERQFLRQSPSYSERPAQALLLQVLPSTSPAMASLSFAEKRERWHRFFIAAGLL
jgi:hypoxanthine-DNA glycosylase